jgi:MFS family permease
MGGVLVSSTISGQIISRLGRYRMFPILGTAVMTIGLFLLSTLSVATPSLTASGYMMVLGIGLGMVMQVLVLAVQNNVDFRDLGVATSGTTLFRSAGGSIGVSLFGAIFAASLAGRLASVFPAGASAPAAGDPAAVARLPAAARALYLHAFTDALHPVFLSAAAIAALAFLLTFLLREAPLRGPRSETIGESFAVPRQASSVEELESMIERMLAHEGRWSALQRIAEQIGATGSPDEVWLLIQLHLRGGSASFAELCRSAEECGDVGQVAERLAGAGLVEIIADRSAILTREGRAAAERVLAAYGERLAAYLEQWSPAEREEVRTIIRHFIADLMADFPARAAA